MSRPVRFRWNGEAMEPASIGQMRIADQEYCIGETYDLVPVEHRSMKSHNHYFAWLSEAFDSLPEQHQHEPWAQSVEHLRHYALIRSRFCNTQTFACGSAAEALRWAGNLRPLDEYSLVSVQGATVYRFTAESQSMRAMGKERFEASKHAVLDFVAGLIGVAPDELARVKEAA